MDTWYCGNGTEPIAIWGGEVGGGRERGREGGGGDERDRGREVRCEGEEGGACHSHTITTYTAHVY